VTKGLTRATITLKVSSVNVCFGPETMAARGLAAPCVDAAVTALDPALDLAVLLVGGASNLPYVPFGDSDVVGAGLAVDALGYPFGREVEVGRVATAPDLVPDVSTTPGAISALRSNDAGARRYLQITNSVNPGNSGGPLLNRDGFAVGVIQSKLMGAAEIAFAIPINEVKNFLDTHGLDHVMPVRRLRLGVFQAIEGKGLGLRLPEGFVDRSWFMSHVETDAEAGDVAFRLDRVRSPWTPGRVAEALVSGKAFEPLAMSPRTGRDALGPPVPSLLLGGAAGTEAESGREFRMDHAVLELGSEKLVARYVGPAEHMAYNESVLRESLISLQGQRLTAAALPDADKVLWTARTDPNGRSVPVPVGWVVEPGRPSACGGVPEPQMVASASPARDASIVLRVAVWSDGVVPDAAALACAPSRGTAGPASYSTSVEWLGVSYIIEGIFTQAPSGQIVQLEVLATEPRTAFARALLGIWLKRASE
jgi:hypothetical protein